MLSKCMACFMSGQDRYKDEEEGGGRKGKRMARIDVRSAWRW